MRTLTIFSFLLFSLASYSQDKAVLEDQFTQLFNDFPNKFANVAKPNNEYRLKFQIPGAMETRINNDHGDYYITAVLDMMISKEDAKKNFDKWVEIISSLTVNGTKLKKVDSSKDGDSYYCRWEVVDDKGKNKKSKQKVFSISISFSDDGFGYGGIMNFGNLD